MVPWWLASPQHTSAIITVLITTNYTPSTLLNCHFSILNAIFFSIGVQTCNAPKAFPSLAFSTPAVSFCKKGWKFFSVGRIGSLWIHSFASAKDQASQSFPSCSRWGTRSKRDLSLQQSGEAMSGTPGSPFLPHVLLADHLARNQGIVQTCVIATPQIHWTWTMKHSIITIISNILVSVQATNFAENKEPSWSAADKINELKQRCEWIFFGPSFCFYLSALGFSLLPVSQWAFLLKVFLAPSVILGTKSLILLGSFSDTRKPCHGEVRESLFPWRHSSPPQSNRILKEIACQPEMIYSWCNLGRVASFRGRCCGAEFLLTSFWELHLIHL